MLAHTNNAILSVDFHDTGAGHVLYCFQAQLKLNDKYMAEFNKIDGFYLGIEMNMMGVKITSTVQEINPTRIAPANTYQVAESYVKKDSLSMKEVVIK